MNLPTQRLYFSNSDSFSIFLWPDGILKLPVDLADLIQNQFRSANISGGSSYPKNNVRNIKRIFSPGEKAFIDEYSYPGILRINSYFNTKEKFPDKSIVLISGLNLSHFIGYINL
ncbi:MAG: hypothetical protein H7A24_08205 [Leptospiraceae bacterium]|nr:hypothetical protein [Leptospiraceae bacterium]MCP5511849.1 hypothetical protein [Leptospiraceae bacterium]